MRVKAKKSFYARRKKPVWFKNKWFWRGLVFILILAGLFSFFGFGRAFFLKKVEVQGNQTISSENIEAVALENVRDFVPFFKSNSVFFIDRGFLVQVLKSSFPRASQVKAKLKLPDTIQIIIKEREAKAVFCRLENCYLIDEQGVVFKEVSGNEEARTGFLFDSSKNGPGQTSGLIQIENEEFADEISLGQKVITEVDVKKLLAIAGGLSAAPETNLKKISRINAKRANVFLQEGWQIFFNLDDQIPYQISNFKLVLEKEIGLERRKKLEYIDLRFGSRVYYKFLEDQ